MWSFLVENVDWISTYGSEFNVDHNFDAKQHGTRLVRKISVLY